jgi:hypothetical protein
MMKSICLDVFIFSLQPSELVFGLVAQFRVSGFEY